MQIGGLQKCSLIDYPERTSAVIFATGCNFRCFYCHNPQLVYKEKYPKPISEITVLDFLAARKKLLQGVVISGGEPAMQPDLPDFLFKIKQLGYPIKLDTNGSNPAMLKFLAKEKLIDAVAMDIKAPFALYEKICGAPVNVADIKESINFIKSSGLEHYFRTTLPSDADETFKTKIKAAAGRSPHIFQKLIDQ